MLSISKQQSSTIEVANIQFDWWFIIRLRFVSFFMNDENKKSVSYSQHGFPVRNGCK